MEAAALGMAHSSQAGGRGHTSPVLPRLAPAPGLPHLSSGGSAARPFPWLHRLPSAGLRQRHLYL